jgi:hypothetical protein
MLVSAAFRGSPEPEMTTLRGDVVPIEHSDPAAGRPELSTDTYGVFRNGRAFLLDTNFSALMPFVRELAAPGFAPAALVISHRHVAGTGDAMRTLAKEFKIPFLIHPLDAGHPRAMASEGPFENVFGHPLPAEFGPEELHLPGQPSGRIALNGAEKAGLLFTGDAAMGTRAGQAASGIEGLIRPPAGLSTDHAQLRKQWLSFARPVATALPYHGTCYADRAADIARIMAPLTRDQPTTGFA